MPPKRSAAAAAAAGPTLKLIVEKGPLSGTTREFKPGTAVRIGRFVRGNKITIKDAGISSNHLVIHAEAADGWRWTVSDLDSSNGTILNDTQLDPFESVDLSHGDKIKIGEKTTIRVEMVESSGEDNEVCSGVRRNARRGVSVREQAADLEVIEEFAELGLQNNVDEVKIEVEAKQGRSTNTRRTRNSMKTENLTTGVSSRRTRSSRKEDNVEEIEVDLSVIEGKRPRRGGGRKKLFAETICEETEKEEPNPEHQTRKEEKEEPKPEHETCQEEKERAETRGDKLKNTATGKGVAAGGTTGSTGDGKGKMKMVADLEKMTLGEWLEFLMVYEPQQIIAETEEMIAEMKRKAERCHEFMLQQKKAQGSQH